MQKKLIKNKNFSRIFQSEKGDAMILISVIITGLVVLVSTVALENLKKAGAVQGLQKASLDKLYKAEEGIELGLFVNREAFEAPNKNPMDFCQDANPSKNCKPFNLSVIDREAGGGPNTGKKAVEKLSENPLDKNKDLIMVSQNSTDLSNSKEPKRSLMANLPSRYFNQAPIAGPALECTGCTVYGPGEEPNTYKILLKTNRRPIDELKDFQIFFHCVKKCSISGVKIGIECKDFDGTDFKCDVASEVIGMNSADSAKHPRTKKFEIDEVFDDLGNDYSLPEKIAITFTVSGENIKSRKFDSCDETKPLTLKLSSNQWKPVGDCKILEVDVKAKKNSGKQ
mgnify:CR=1 FL=1